MQDFQDGELFITKNILRGGIPNVMGDRYVKNEENTKIVYMDINNLHGWFESTFTIQTPSI